MALKGEVLDASKRYCRWFSKMTVLMSIYRLKNKDSEECEASKKKLPPVKEAAQYKRRAVNR